MSRRGFTLMEMLLAVVIVGLLLALALPTLAGTVSRQAAWNARSVAIGMYNRARASAVESGRATTLSFTGNVAMITASPRMSGVGTVDTIGNLENFTTSFGVTVTGTPGTTLTIDPRGLGSSASTTIWFTRNGRQDSMVVTGFGRVVR